MPFGRNFVLTLSAGMFCGFFSFYLLNSTRTLQSNYLEGLSYDGRAHSHKEIEDDAGPDADVQMHSHSEIYHKGESEEADRMAEKVRVLCWVMTNPENHEEKARQVKATWGRRCNKFILISTVEDKYLGTVSLPVPEGRDHLWQKTKEAFRYVHKHHLHEAEWFMKADDDTYVIVENLRYMLSPYNSSLPLWFGCRFKMYMKQGYMSGGPGYVLSKEALVRFVEKGIPDPMKCRGNDGGVEDVEIGKCLENVGVIAMDSRDSLGRDRFFPLFIDNHLIPGQIKADSWYWHFIYYQPKVGMDSCSDTAVSFHYVPPNKMYELEYYIYHLRLYGIQRRLPPLDHKSPPSRRGE